MLLPVHTLVLDSLTRVLLPLARVLDSLTRVLLHPLVALLPGIEASLARVLVSLARVLALPLIGVLACWIWQGWVSPCGGDRVGFDAEARSSLALTLAIHILMGRMSVTLVEVDSPRS